MEAAKIILFLLLPAFFFICVYTTSVNHCVNGTGPLPEEVIASNCTASPCIFYFDVDSTITMKFRSPRYMEHFEPNALVFAEGLTIPYPLLQFDGCIGVINTPCPLAANEYTEYSYSMFIPSSLFPQISFTIEFSLVDKDQNNAQFQCFSMDVQLEYLP